MRGYFFRIPNFCHQLYPEAIWKVDQCLQHPLHITIDDGPDPVSTILWLEELDRLKTTATFFVSGANCVEFPELVNEIRHRGHTLGCHGYGHLNGWRTGTDEYTDDLKRGLDIVETELFRPPYGKMTLSQYRQIRNKVKVVMWTLMPGDFDKKIRIETLKRTISNSTPNDIIVFHDSPFAISRMKEAINQLENFPV